MFSSSEAERRARMGQAIAGFRSLWVEFDSAHPRCLRQSTLDKDVWGRRLKTNLIAVFRYRKNLLRGYSIWVQAWLARLAMIA